jgi:hypothetical protein
MYFTLFLAKSKSFQIVYIFKILGLKLGTHLQEAIALECFWFGLHRTITSPRIDQNVPETTDYMLIRFWEHPGNFEFCLGLHVTAAPLSPRDFDGKKLKYEYFERKNFEKRRT